MVSGFFSVLICAAHCVWPLANAARPGLPLFFEDDLQGNDGAVAVRFAAAGGDPVNVHFPRMWMLSVLRRIGGLVIAIVDFGVGPAAHVFDDVLCCPCPGGQV